MRTFTRTVREAVKFFLRNGYTSREELERWQSIIRQAAESETADDYMAMVTRNLNKSYDLQVGRAGALKRHQGISRFTLNYLEPKLRTELDRRILSSADLIQLNRKKLSTQRYRVLAVGPATFLLPIASRCLAFRGRCGQQRIIFRRLPRRWTMKRAA